MQFQQSAEFWRLWYTAPQSVVALNVNSVSFLEVKQSAVKFALKCWRRVLFRCFVGLFIVNKYVHFVIIVCLVHNNSHCSFVSGEYDNGFVGFQSFQCLSFVFSQQRLIV